VRQVRSFLAFWYDFVVGDDWRVAAGVLVAFVAVYGASRAGVVAWWIAPVVVAVLLPVSLRRALRKR
jgi:hypothetical protein